MNSNKHKFYSIGISHWETPIEIREKYSLTNYEIVNIFNKAKKLNIDSLIIISTCNRTQFFSFTNNIEKIRSLFIENTKSQEKKFEKFHFEISNNEAIEQIFNLCCGLDSMILGDMQISNQVKEALILSSKNNLVDPRTHRLMQYVFQAHKNVFNDTNISKGAASISHATVLFIKSKFKTLKNLKILLFGIGQIGKITLKNISNHDCKELVIINRSKSKIKNLNLKSKFRIADLKNLKSEINNCDILIVATNSDKYTVDKIHVNDTRKNTLFIDLSVPRNINPEISEMCNIELVDLDSLQNIQDETLSKRKLSVPKARTIINLYINEFYDWEKMRNLSPTIKALQKKLHEIRLKELEEQKFKLTKKEFEKAEILSKSVVNKINNLVTEYMKTEYRSSDKILKIIEQMFKISQ